MIQPWRAGIGPQSGDVPTDLTDGSLATRSSSGVWWAPHQIGSAAGNPERAVPIDHHHRRTGEPAHGNCRPVVTSTGSPTSLRDAVASGQRLDRGDARDDVVRQLDVAGPPRRGCAGCCRTATVAPGQECTHPSRPSSVSMALAHRRARAACQSATARPWSKPSPRRRAAGRATRRSGRSRRR